MASRELLVYRHGVAIVVAIEEALREKPPMVKLSVLDI